MNELEKRLLGGRRHHEYYIKVDFNLQLINYLIATSSAFPSRSELEAFEKSAGTLFSHSTQKAIVPLKLFSLARSALCW